MNALIKWILPGLVTVAVLTAAANWLEGDAIEAGIGKKIEKALGRDHPWAELAMERRDVTVSGLAPSAEVSRDAFARIASVTGIREVVDNSGLLPVASPYRFLAERNEAGLSLSGNAPDIQTRDAILKLAKKAAGGAKIEDAIELAAGAPSGFAEAVEGAMNDPLDP